jgi:hypothetical protein
MYRREYAASCHPADVQDRDGGILVMATLFGMP